MHDRRRFLGLAINAAIAGALAVPAIAVAQASEPTAVADRPMTGSPRTRRRPPIRKTSVAPAKTLDGPLKGGSPATRGHARRAQQAAPADAGVTVADAGFAGRAGLGRGTVINPPR